MCPNGWSGVGVPAELHSNLVALTQSCSTFTAFKPVYNRSFLCESCVLTMGTAEENISRAGVGGETFQRLCFDVSIWLTS